MSVCLSVWKVLWQSGPAVWGKVGSVERWVYLMRVVIIEGEGAILGVNLEHPIVTNRAMWSSQITLGGLVTFATPSGKALVWFLSIQHPSFSSFANMGSALLQHHGSAARHWFFLTCVLKLTHQGRHWCSKHKHCSPKYKGRHRLVGDMSP